ncbi:tripartite motif-containing protein 26-like [Strongylocentrotus purpuratus]|uniref:Ubiquitin n=1 Tax=Strongylocentrotus purpuratus TaxID=7668 RepID=A0A7M7NFT3_STRPU|nr:tripartite motif-containing protein 26-like [Strongylocentrotus purpuratus]
MESHVDLKSMYTDLVKNLNCAICQDVLKDARDLSCGHTYCLGCIQELVAIKGWTSKIKCCLCQKETSIPSLGLTSLKQNYKLNCILDEQAGIMKRMVAEKASATEARKTVQIWVRDLEGKSQSIHVRLSDTADALKRQVAKKTGIPSNVQRLIYKGKQVNGSTTLEEYEIKQHSTIELALPLKGGNVTH